MNTTTNVRKLRERLVETKAETIKLGLDLHARDVVVCVQLDGALSQRPQKMLPAELPTLVRGLVAAGRKVYSCYEAGPCGYGLHRELLAAGAINYVVAPAALSDGRQQKTDSLDATALTDRLDRYVRGILLLREVCDWSRFKNRRQVSSYTGLCPGVQQSGGRKRDGCINRHGNPRVRALLIELVWRLARWQPDYPPVKALVAGIARGAARRKCAVAAARKLAVDLWRLATQQTTPEKLHLTVLAEVPA